MFLSCNGVPEQMYKIYVSLYSSRSAFSPKNLCFSEIQSDRIYIMDGRDSYRWDLPRPTKWETCSMSSLVIYLYRSTNLPLDSSTLLTSPNSPPDQLPKLDIPPQHGEEQTHLSSRQAFALNFTFVFTSVREEDGRGRYSLRRLHRSWWLPS